MARPTAPDSCRATRVGASLRGPASPRGPAPPRRPAALAMLAMLAALGTPGTLGTLLACAPPPRRAQAGATAAGGEAAGREGREAAVGDHDGAARLGPGFPARGDVLYGRYRVREALGHAGSVALYRVRHVLLERDYVMRYLDREAGPAAAEAFAADASCFARDRRRLEGLRVRVRDAATGDEGGYQVFEGEGTREPSWMLAPALAPREGDGPAPGEPSCATTAPVPASDLPPPP